MKNKKIKEPTSNGLTLKQMKGYQKKAKGPKKWYWQGRMDGLKGSLRYSNYLEKLKNK